LAVGLPLPGIFVVLLVGVGVADFVALLVGAAVAVAVEVAVVPVLAEPVPLAGTHLPGVPVAVELAEADPSAAEA
jgi:hypothetical protein